MTEGTVFTLHTSHTALTQNIQYMNVLFLIITKNSAEFSSPERTPFYSPLIQDKLGELVLSQRRNLVEQPLDFYDLDVLPAAQHIVSKHYRKTQWFGCLLFYRLTNSVKALKDAASALTYASICFSNYVPFFLHQACFYMLNPHAHAYT